MKFINIAGSEILGGNQRRESSKDRALAISLVDSAEKKIILREKKKRWTGLVDHVTCLPDAAARLSSPAHFHYEPIVCR